MSVARGVVIGSVVASGMGMGGCVVGKLVGGMAQNFEYQKLIEVHPAYPDLEGQKVAVLVEADLSTLYEHPDVPLTIAANLSRRLQQEVPGCTTVPAALVSEWQFRTPRWNTLPYGEIAANLKADRLVHIDLYEYRLHPPGNSWLWEGVCAANVGVVEPDGMDPDNFVEVFNVAVEFPGLQGVVREGATAGQVQTGLLTKFVEKSSWLFYTHLEPKYPDKYKQYETK